LSLAPASFHVEEFSSRVNMTFASDCGCVNSARNHLENIGKELRKIVFLFNGLLLSVAIYFCPFQKPC